MHRVDPRPDGIHSFRQFGPGYLRVLVECLKNPAEKTVLLLSRFCVDADRILHAHAPGSDDVTELERERLAHRSAIRELSGGRVPHLGILENLVEKESNRRLLCRGVLLEMRSAGHLDRDVVIGEQDGKLLFKQTDQRLPRVFNHLPRSHLPRLSPLPMRAHARETRTACQAPTWCLTRSFGHGAVVRDTERV